MKLFICIDEKFGMMFNNRRQSKDREVIAKINEILAGNELYITEYSKSLFDKGIVCENFERCEGYVFIENPDLITSDNIEELYIFKWNRHYPSDKKLNIDLSDYKMIETEDFVGYSHEKITLERYAKENAKWN